MVSSLPELSTDDCGDIASYEVRVAGTDLCFRVRPGERMLGAARRAGVWLPYECGWGSCSTCKATLVEGQVELLYPDAPALDPRDERRRRILVCQSTACSDVTLKVMRTGASEARPTRDYQAELTSADELGPDIRRFRFRLDATSSYRAGQHGILELEPGLRRCYSMAGLPGTDKLEFIAKRYPGRPGSTALFGLSAGDRVPIELPYGDMWLRTNHRDAVLTAGGTGISAIIALLRQLADTNTTRQVHVFYGANTEDELVCWDELQTLVARLSSARLYGAVARPASGWSGITGFVTDALGPQLATLTDVDHYLAGPPVMVDAVLALLREHDTPLDRIHYDRFG